jgi:3-isopropylmalate dehydrogenase/3-isopropylmalate/(R)-2-methylmalate dehydratase small subunit
VVQSINKIKGRAWKYGDNINTDEIIPARYLNITDPHELARYCMKDLDESFASKVRAGDVLVGGTNFGCGSSREHAPICIKAVGISCVIATSFARIFFRNAINIGLPIIESEQAALNIHTGDQVEVNVEIGKIINLTRQEEYEIVPYPPFMKELIASGGLMNYIKGVIS